MLLALHPVNLSFCYDHETQGVIKLGDQRAESKCTLVYGQMNEPPGARARVALTGKACRNHDGQPEEFVLF